MSGVYKSLKVIIQDTLRRGKTDSMPLARVKGSSALSLNDEMDELERIIADRIGRLKAAVKEGEAVVADEAQHAEQLVESLRVSIADAVQEIVSPELFHRITGELTEVMGVMGPIA